MQLNYDKEAANLRRQLDAAMKTINTMVDKQTKDAKEFELNKKKLTQLEMRFLTDTTKINSLEAKCNKYKKTSEMLKEKAKNVLEMSQKCVNSTFNGRQVSPVSLLHTTKNNTGSSFNLSPTETDLVTSGAKK